MSPGQPRQLHGRHGVNNSNAVNILSSSDEPLCIRKEIKLDELSQRLFSFTMLDHRNHVKLSVPECLAVCRQVKEKVMQHGLCLEVARPVVVIGDIHGQFHDLLRILDQLGKPPGTRYLFLGDYVDRGKYSLEVIMLLFVTYLTNKDGFYLLRGNHEAVNVSSRYGFAHELLERYGKQAKIVFKSFIECFRWMPICAIVGGEIFCCHGGPSPFFEMPPFHPPGPDSQRKNIQIINQLQRPSDPPTHGAICDLLWADPLSTYAPASLFNGAKLLPRRWSASTRACSFLFSEAALNDMLKQFEVKMLVRAHQLLQDGYGSHFNGKCITIFSAPGYCGKETNKACALQIFGEYDKKKKFMNVVKFDVSNRDTANLFWKDEELISPRTLAEVKAMDPYT